MRSVLYKIFISSVLLALLITPASAQIPDDCEIGDDVLADIRLMLTAEDNGMFFEIWTPEELACACIELYYNDPDDAFLHDRVITGAVVLLGMTGDPRAVPVLIDAIDTHPPQALYNLGSYSTIESLNALVANVRNENDESRENAAEGLRRMQSPSTSEMQAPSTSEMEDGWSDALEMALEEVGDWIDEEPEWDIKLYFLEAHDNLEQLLEQATTTGGVE